MSFHRPYLEICPIKVHKTLPNGRFGIYKEVSTGGCTQKNYPPCAHDINREHFIFGWNYFPFIHRPYLEICPIKVHETVSNGRQGIYNEVSTGRCTQKNYPLVPMDIN